MKGPKDSKQTRAAWAAAKKWREVIAEEALNYTAFGAHDSDPKFLERMASTLDSIESIAIACESRDIDRWAEEQEAEESGP